MTDLRTITTILQGLTVDVRHSSLSLEEIMSWLDEALSNLRGISDPAAREAESSIRDAISNLRETVFTWFPDYMTRIDDLCNKMAN